MHPSELSAARSHLGPPDSHLLPHRHPGTVSSLNGRFSPLRYPSLLDSAMVIYHRPARRGGDEVIRTKSWKTMDLAIPAKNSKYFVMKFRRFESFISLSRCHTAGNAVKEN